MWGSTSLSGVCTPVRVSCPGTHRCTWKWHQPYRWCTHGLKGRTFTMQWQWDISFNQYMITYLRTQLLTGCSHWNQFKVGSGQMNWFTKLPNPVYQISFVFTLQEICKMIQVHWPVPSFVKSPSVGSVWVMSCSPLMRGKSSVHVSFRHSHAMNRSASVEAFYK